MKTKDINKTDGLLVCDVEDHTVYAVESMNLYTLPTCVQHDRITLICVDSVKTISLSDKIQET